MTTRSRYTAAVTDKPWWLAGGIPAGACSAAWQFVGGQNRLLTKNDLINGRVGFGADSGTLSAADGILCNADTRSYAQREYAKFSGLNSNNCSWIAAIGTPTIDGNIHILFRLRYGSYNAQFTVAATTGLLTVNNYGAYDTGEQVTAGVYAFGGNTFYKNAVPITTIAGGVYGTSSNADAIGCGYAGTSYYDGYVKALAFYTVGLTHYQIAALTDAINAL